MNMDPVTTFYLGAYDPYLRFVNLGSFVTCPSGTHPVEMAAILILSSRHPVHGYKVEPTLSTMFKAEAKLLSGPAGEETPDTVIVNLTKAIKAPRCSSIMMEQVHTSMLHKAMEYLDTLLVDVCRGCGTTGAVRSIYMLKRAMCDVSSCMDNIEDVLPRSMQLLERLCDEEAHRRLMDKKARVLQTAWRDVVSNPRMEVCHRRLMREFADLNSTVQVV